jgi:FkbM family methyltransferase
VTGHAIRRALSYVTALPVMLRGFRLRSLAAALGGAATGRTFLLETKDGVRLRARTLLDAWIVKETCLDGEYDEAMPARRDALIVDAGAALGDYAIRMARRFPEARVVALEPFPGSFELLKENLARNGAANVVALPYALVGDAKPTARLAVAGSEPVRYGTEGGGPHGLEVPARTLEALLDELGAPRCDVLKLDCEGAEYAILMNAAPAVLARVDRIVLEYHEGLGPYGGADLARHLSAHGFAVTLRPSRVRAELGILLAERRGASS